MMKTDKYNNIMTNVDDKLDQYNFANLFNVVQLGEKSYFNICKTIQFDNMDYMIACIDTSGSMTNDQLKILLSEVYAIALVKKPIKLYVVFLVKDFTSV